MASILASGFKEEYDGGLSYKFCLKKIKLGEITNWNKNIFKAFSDLKNKTSQQEIT